MTKRKPAGVPFETWIDAQIREARERGDFDDLPDEGAPLPNLADASDPFWWAKQLMRREQISVLPPALEVRRLVEQLAEALPTFPRESQVRAALQELNLAIRKANRVAGAGPPTSQPLLDEDLWVERWRAARGDREGS